MNKPLSLLSFAGRCWGAGVLSALLVACGGGGSDTMSGAAERLPAPPPPAVVAPVPPPPVTPPAPPVPPAVNVTALRERVGQLIFSDPNLSEPRGTACVACHQPNRGFAGNNGSRIGVPLGSLGKLGLRNAMTNAYGGFVPGFGFRVEAGVLEAVGGHFWDGRADTLALQALGPFLNPAEMNNPNGKAVVDKIAASNYANLFRQAFGDNVFANPDTAYTQVGVAIEAFERSTVLQSFSSKFDAMVQGKATFTPAESRGMVLFQDPNRANCAGCHTMNATSGKPQDSLFSDFSYYATGIPRNPDIPANADPAFFDLGLCGPNRDKPVLPADAPAGSSVESFCGKFRMPTLRNVAERPMYMHNGVFRDLREVVRFYATRNSAPRAWYGPAGIPNDLPTAYQGNLEVTKAPFNRRRNDGPVLNDAEIDDVLAFLRTLSDGFTAP